MACEINQYSAIITDKNKSNICSCLKSGEPGLVDKVLALHAGSRGFDSHRGRMSERFFRSNRPGYPHPVSSELENSGIRVAVGDCSVTERRRWRPPYQTGKTVHVHAKHYKHNEDGRTAPGVCGNGSVPLSHSGNVVTRIGIHTRSCLKRVHKYRTDFFFCFFGFYVLFFFYISMPFFSLQNLLKGFSIVVPPTRSFFFNDQKCYKLLLSRTLGKLNGK